MAHADLPSMLGQLLLAALILGQTIASSWQSAQRRREDKEDREEIARQLQASTKLLAEQVAEASRQRAEEIKAQLVEVHEDVSAKIVQNTEVNEAALTAANNSNEKLPAITKLAQQLARVQEVSKVEIVQPENHPIPVKEVGD